MWINPLEITRRLPHIDPMKQILMTAALCTLPITAHAQDKPADQLLRLFELFSDETETILEDLMKELGPALESFSGMMDDITLYQAPEILPNGDIIIRRKPDAPKPQPLNNGEIEL